MKLSTIQFSENRFVRAGFAWRLCELIPSIQLKWKVRAKLLSRCSKFRILQWSTLNFFSNILDVDWYAAVNGVDNTEYACFMHFFSFGMQHGFSPCSALAHGETKYISWLGVLVLQEGQIPLSTNNIAQNSILESKKELEGIHTKASLSNVCVVTAIFGESDNLLPFSYQLGVNSDAFVVCDSQDARSFVGRRRVEIDTSSHSDPRHHARHAKLRLLKYFSDLGYDWMIWHDANIDFKIDPSAIFAPEIAKNLDIVSFKHPVRTSVLDEAVACCASGKAPISIIVTQVTEYLRDSNFKDGLLFETNVYLANLKSSRTHELFDRWGAEVGRHSLRDQVAFPYVLQQVCGLRWDFFSINELERSAVFLSRPHRDTLVSKC